MALGFITILNRKTMKLHKVKCDLKTYSVSVFDNNDDLVGQFNARRNNENPDSNFPFDISCKDDGLLMRIVPSLNEIYDWLLDERISNLDI